ncbi:MAG TPA: ABC transporter permease [Vicinamibacterales bacterium]|nr:ABC transporter permease [Vicinamibacterales bacterium]
MRLYRVLARAARFEAADLATAHAEMTFGHVCEAAARRGSLVLTVVALRELGVMAGVIALAWLRQLPGPRWPRNLLSPREIRIAVRSLLRSHRGYVAMATFVLAVAVGVNLVVFTVVNALWIRPLPIAEPGRVVTIPSAVTRSLEQVRDHVFEGGVAGQVMTADQYGGLTPEIELPDAGRRLETLGVTPSYFKLFGLPIRGRDFTSEDDRDGAEPVAIISDRLWSSTFGRRPDVIGSVVPARPFPIRIIGVAPPAFEGARRGERADLWISTRLVRRLAPADWPSSSLGMIVFGRLGPAQTIAAVDQHYRDVSTTPEARAWFEANEPGWFTTPLVVPLDAVFGTPETRTLIVSEHDAFLLVSGLATLVLVAGCATMAALVLVHYERRRAELALKLSLGAPRRRLALELVRELLLIGSLGTIGGIAVSLAGVRLLPAFAVAGGVDLGRLDLSIDWRVLAVAIAATLITLLGAAVRPVTRATRQRLGSELVAGSSSTSLASQRARQGLLAFQVCATIVVLVAAGLFVRAVIHGFGNAPGFDVDRTVFVSVQEGNPQGSAAVDRQGIRSLIAERDARMSRVLRSLPGVRHVAVGISPIGPDARLGRPVTVRVEDREEPLLIGRLGGGHELLSALGVPMLAGRSLTAADASGVPVAAVLTQSLADRLWPDGGALGRTMSLPQLRSGPYLIVGIAGDLAFGSLTERGAGVLVTAQPLGSTIVSNFVVRTDEPELVVGHIHRAIKGQVVEATTGREVIARDLGRQRLGAWFFSGFGLAALLLGIGGAFGLVAYLAESQRREFGIRLALGASMGHLVRHGLVAALLPVSVGVAAGLVLAGLMSQLFTAFLAGISALDPATYLLVAVITIGCAALAALLAAWRLRCTRPSDALRAS